MKKLYIDIPGCSQELYALLDKWMDLDYKATGKQWSPSEYRLNGQIWKGRELELKSHLNKNYG